MPRHVMTKEEVVVKLNAMGRYSDHCDADDLLLEYLVSIGHADVAQAYNALIERAGSWWYA